MVSVCFYFQVHQPLRIRKYPVFDIGKISNYFDNPKNIEVLQRVVRKCYIPMNNLLLRLIKKYNGRFKVAFSISGICLEQLEKHSPIVIESFKRLAETGCVEFLAETHYHSLSFIYNRSEYEKQIKMHVEKIQQLFKQKPRILRNTELIYRNDIAYEAEKLGFEAVLAEGADHVLGWRSPNFVYKAKDKNIKLLLKNYKLSDDIAFRFSERSWSEWPLTAEKFAKWVSAINGNGNTVNLFMDYETFGEHQWVETGIFEFIEKLPEEILKHPDNNFKLPSEIIKIYSPVGELDIPFYLSWADTERDLSAWTGNNMQKTALRELYNIYSSIILLEDEKLLKDWRTLTTSDHFYYMCTKWFNDGDVHKYFNAYDSPYEAFINFMNVLNDLTKRINKKIEKEDPSKNVVIESPQKISGKITGKSL